MKTVLKMTDSQLEQVEDFVHKHKKFDYFTLIGLEKIFKKMKIIK